MSKLLQKLVACYLVLCLASAGAIGISPLLHQWIEHDGRGQPHVHFASQTGPTAALTHDDSEPHTHEHDNPSTHFAPRQLFAHSREFKLPTISWDSLWHSICHFVGESTAPGPTPAQDGPGHEHNGLPQMLVNGLVEQYFDLPVLFFRPPSLVTFILSADTFIPARDWDALTSGRGPPFAQS